MCACWCVLFSHVFQFFIRVYCRSILSTEGIHEMVWSSINRSYQYPEHTEPSEHDMDTELHVYSITLNGDTVDIFVGQIDTETVPGVNTYPIYVNTETRYAKIGLFEISSNQSRACLDSAGNVDISRLGNPILFHSADEHIRAARPVKVKVLNTDITDEKESFVSENDSVRLVDIDMNQLDLKLKAVPIQSLGLYEREKMRDTTAKNQRLRKRETARRHGSARKRGWFPRQVRSTTLNQVVGEKKSDLLDCVVAALNSVAQKSVNSNQIRIAFAEKLTSSSSSYVEQFDGLSVIAKSYKRVTDKFRLRMEKLSADNASMRLKTVSDMGLANEMIQRGSTNKLVFDRLRIGTKLLDQMAVRIGISNIDSFDHLMDDIASRRIHVGVAFLSAIEQIFGIKLVVFVRSEEIDDGYWIAKTDTSHTITVHVAMDNTQCQLISYKSNTVFTEKAVPWAISMAEATHSPVVGSIDDVPSNITLSSSVFTCSASVEDGIPGFAIGEHVDANTYVDIPNELLDSMMSSATPAMQRSPAADLYSYISLYEAGSWRAMLSDEWKCDINYKGNWESVTHYLASGDTTEEDVYAIYESKFSQHPSLRNILELTGRASLMVFDNSTEPSTSRKSRKLVPNIMLMKLREKIFSS